MSGRIVRRRAALEDLVDQTAWYITHAGQAVADRFDEAVERALQALLATPGIGAPRPRANPALRGLRMHPVRGFESHLIFYRPITDGIELIRVLHGAREIEAILEAEPDPGREAE
jgi:toxin ParE1/3/4